MQGLLYRAKINQSAIDETKQKLDHTHKSLEYKRKSSLMFMKMYPYYQ